MTGEDQTLTSASVLADVDTNALMDHLVNRLLHGSPRYTPVQITTASGVERDVSRRLWRAMGLADVPDDVVAFTEMDLDALERTKTLLGRARSRSISSSSWPGCWARPPPASPIRFRGGLHPGPLGSRLGEQRVGRRGGQDFGEGRVLVGGWVLGGGRVLGGGWVLGEGPGNRV